MAGNTGRIPQKNRENIPDYTRENIPSIIKTDE